MTVGPGNSFDAPLACGLGLFDDVHWEITRHQAMRTFPKQYFSMTFIRLSSLLPNTFRLSVNVGIQCANRSRATLPFPNRMIHRRIRPQEQCD